MQNNKWTHNEEKDMVLKLRRGMQMKNIANTSGRSYGAIKERLKKIIYENIKNINNDQEVEKVSKYLNLDNNLIKKYYYAYGDRLEQIKVKPIDVKPINVKPIDVKQKLIQSGDVKPIDVKPIDVKQELIQSGGVNVDMAIRRQNNIFEEIIKNHELKKKIGKLIKTKQLDNISKNILKKLLLNKN